MNRLITVPVRCGSGHFNGTVSMRTDFYPDGMKSFLCPKCGSGLFEIHPAQRKGEVTVKIVKTKPTKLKPWSL